MIPRSKLCDILKKIDEKQSDNKSLVKDIDQKYNKIKQFSVNLEKKHAELQEFQRNLVVTNEETHQLREKHVRKKKVYLCETCCCIWGLKEEIAGRA